VHGIEALLTAMTDLVKRVAAERPALRKLTFVISWNLGTSRAHRQGRQLKSQRDKYDDKVILAAGHSRREPDRIRPRPGK
jgi:hypothetical protein